MIYFQKKEISLSLMMSLVVLSISISPILAASGFTFAKISQSYFVADSDWVDVAIAGDDDEIFLSRSNTSGPAVVEIYNQPSSYTPFPVLNKSYSISSTTYCNYFKVAADGTRFLCGVDISEHLAMYSRDTQTALWTFDDIYANYERFITYSLNMDLVAAIRYTNAPSLDIVVVNGTTGTLLWNHSIITDMIPWGISMNSAGTLLTYSAYVDGEPTIIGFNAITGDVLWEKLTDEKVYDLVISTSGRYVTGRFGSYQKTLVLNGTTGEFVRNFTISDGAFASSKFLDDEHTLITSIYNTGAGVGYFTSYNLESSSSAPTWEKEVDIGSSIFQISPNGIVVGIQFYGKITFIEVATGNVIFTEEIGKSSTWLYLEIGISQSGGAIAVVNNYNGFVPTSFGLYHVSGEETSQDSSGTFLDSLKNTFIMDNFYGLVIVGVAGLILGLILKGKKK